MKTVFRFFTIIIAVLLIIYVSLYSLSSESSEIDNNLNVATLVATQQISPNVQSNGIDSIQFQDNPDVYKNDDPGSVITIYVTVKGGDNFTWQQINEIQSVAEANAELENSDKPIVEAIVQFGNDSGPLPTEIGYNALIPNSTIETRQANAPFDPQKSYKIVLFDSTGTWRGQSIINLNKHLSDDTRFRNKLSFDLLKQIPNMVSLRTQFVHLYVKDETSDPPQTAFFDYGLFTQVEQPNKRYLESRLLDRDGQLYKANNFNFAEYPEQIRLVTDPLYDETSFSQILEIRGSNDHSKLIQMLADVNNEDIPIEQTFEKYFDAENYFTWMAFNILVGNIDTATQSYLLYSPRNGNKWYFIPWDYDNAFPLQSSPEYAVKEFLPWQKGVSAYWGVVLHQRVLQVGQYEDMLDEKLDELLDILYPDAINALINSYQPVIDKYSFVMPDVYYIPINLDTSHKIAGLLSSDIDTNYNLYVKSLEEPLPFSVDAPTLNNNLISFKWDEAYDMGSRDISYHFVLGKDWAFQDLVFEKKLFDTSIDVPFELLSSGKYFWRVTAINSIQGVQYSYDYYVDQNSEIHPGVKVFYVTINGEVLE
jgi:spore coat protein H